MHVVTVTFEVDPGRVEEFRTAMLQQALYEVYDDAAAFELHLASDHFRAFDETVRPWVQRKDVQVWRQIT